MAAFSMFTVAISKTIYYSSIGEAIVIFTVTILAAIISLFMLFHTIYKFFVEDISHTLQDDLIENERPRSSSSMTGKRKTRTKIKISKTYGSSEPSHHKEIHQVIALFTILYLFSGVSYTLTQSIIRIMTIFLGSNSSCYVNEYLQIMVAATRCLLYLLFLSRLYLTFLGSQLAYSSIRLIILGIIIFIANFGAIIYWIIDTTKQIQNNHGNCSPKNMDYTIPSTVVIIVDTLINIVLLYLFVHKLSQLIRTQTEGYEIMNEADAASLKRIKDLIKLMTKLTVLAGCAVITSWLTTAIFIGWLPHIVTIIDVIVGTFCILFCYEFHTKLYMNCCFMCRQCCYHVCFWWFISEDYICKKNDERDKKKDGFEGGFCAVLCVFCKYDNNDNNQLIDGDLYTNDSDILPKLPKNQSIQSSMNQNGQSVQSGHNLHIPIPDGGKNLTDQILKSPTDDFSAGPISKTETISQTIERGQTNHAFAHRACTLKKIQHLLYEDEGIDGNVNNLRFTLRMSKRVHTLRNMRSIDIPIIKESVDMDQQKEEDDNQENEIKKEKEEEQMKLKEKENENDNMEKQKSTEIVYTDEYHE